MYTFISYSTFFPTEFPVVFLFGKYFNSNIVKLTNSTSFGVLKTQIQMELKFGKWFTTLKPVSLPVEQNTCLPELWELSEIMYN